MCCAGGTATSWGAAPWQEATQPTHWEEQRTHPSGTATHHLRRPHDVRGRVRAVLLPQGLRVVVQGPCVRCSCGRGLRSRPGVLLAPLRGRGARGVGEGIQPRDLGGVV